MSMKKECDRCGEEVDKFRDLKKINGERICKKCYIENRKTKRKNHIESDESLKRDLNELKNKEQRMWQREKYRKKAEQEGREVRSWERGGKTYLPKIKGSISGIQKQKDKSNSYLTLHEKQDLFRILIKKGCDGEEAKERIRNLIKSQKEIREIMKQKNKSEEQIRMKQQELLEELWRF